VDTEKFSFPEPVDEESESPEAATDFDLLKSELIEVLDSLSPRERDILKMRQGLDDDHEKTLSEIGEIYNLSRDRIRQIEAKALRKLRHPNRNGTLKDFLR
jgi:RNA polymerase primary sigma factor